MIGVTDHAMLRFIECEMGINTQELRDQVAAQIARASSAAAQLGVNNYNVQVAGHVYIVRDLTVVSVLPDEASDIARTRTLPPCRGAARP